MDGCGEDPTTVQGRDIEREKETDEKRIVAFQTRAGWLGCDRGQMQVGRKGSCCYGGVSCEAGAALYPDLSQGCCNMQYIYAEYVFLVNVIYLSTDAFS